MFEDVLFLPFLLHATELQNTCSLDLQTPRKKSLETQITIFSAIVFHIIDTLITYLLFFHLHSSNDETYESRTVDKQSIVVASDYMHPKTSISCAYFIATKTMAQGVHKLRAGWSMT